VGIYSLRRNEGVDDGWTLVLRAPVTLEAEDRSSRCPAGGVGSPEGRPKCRPFSFHRHRDDAPRLGFRGWRKTMAKRPMTNIEKVTHIMSYSDYGALAQMFVMDALHKWSGIISKTEPQKVDNGFVSGEAWIGVAREIQKAMQTEMSIEEAEFEEDETPFGEIRF
jgi:hypothetical protein